MSKFWFELSLPADFTRNDRDVLAPAKPEERPHVTLLYVGDPSKWGYTELDLLNAGDTAARHLDFWPVFIWAADLEVFQPVGALVRHVQSRELVRLHNDLRAQLPNIQLDFPFTPHVTIGFDPPQDWATRDVAPTLITSDIEFSLRRSGDVDPAVVWNI